MVGQMYKDVKGMWFCYFWGKIGWDGVIVFLWCLECLLCWYLEEIYNGFDIVLGVILFRICCGVVYIKNFFVEDYCDVCVIVLFGDDRKFIDIWRFVFIEVVVGGVVEMQFFVMMVNLIG